MDDSLPSIAPQQPPQLQTSLQKLLNWLKQHRVLVIIVVSIFVIVGLLFFLLKSPLVSNLKTKTATKQNTTKLPNNVVAEVDGAPIFTSMVELEMSQSKSTPSADLRKKIVQKLINDELTLKYGQEQGIVNHEANSETMNDTQYQQRLHDIALVKQSIMQNADRYVGEIVAVNFYNNGQNNPADLERDKQTASQKITEVYTQVKNNQLTMKQAGEKLKQDPSLKAIDSALDQNAYVTYSVNKGRNITFWLDFDALLLKAEPDKVTDLYLGKQKDKNGVEQNAIYIFGKMNSKVENMGYSTYQQWLDKQRSNHEIIQ